jgi:hypothetical protein
MIRWQQFWQVKFKGDLPDHAYDQKPDLDYPLQEALSGFYFLSERRVISQGFGSATPNHISLNDIKCYHEIYNPFLSLPHFVRVISAADRTYLEIINNDLRQKSKVKTKGK